MQEREITLLSLSQDLADPSTFNDCPVYPILHGNQPTGCMYIKHHPFNHGNLEVAQ